MPQLSPTAAAKQWKTSKTTIYKLMNDGELSYTLNEKKKRVLDVSELVRVLGEPERTEKTSIDTMQDQINRQNNELVQVLKSQVETQQEQIKTLTSAIERFSLLLEHQQIPQPEPEEKTPEPTVEPVQAEHSPQPAKRKKSLFGRILSAVVEE